MKDKKLGYYQSLRWLDSNGARELINLIAKIELTEQELIQQITHGEADNSLAVYVDIGVSDGAIDSDRGFIAMTLGRKQRLVALDGRKLGRSPLSLFVYHEAEYRPDGMVFLPSQPKDKTITLEDFLGGDKGLGLWSADTKSLKPRYPLYFFRSEVEEWAKRIGGEPDQQALQEENQHLQQEIEAFIAEVERLEAEKEYLQREMLATERAHNRLADQLTALTEQHDLCVISLEGANEETEDAYREVERLQAENTELKEEVGRLQADSKNGAVLFGHESENLRLVEWAINEFYHPDKFDVNDPKTHPKQEYMLAEIMRVHGVTGVTAKAVERIATPFSRDRSKK